MKSYVDALEVVLQSAINSELSRTKNDYAAALNRCGDLIERLSIQLRKKKPKDVLSEELCYEADVYLNVLSGLKDDHTYYPKSTQDFYDYVDRKSKEAGWGVERTPIKKPKGKTK